MLIPISRSATYRLALLWTLGIVAALAWPPSGLPERSLAFSFDKLAHVVLFGGFGVFWMGALRGSLRGRAVRIVAAGLLFAAVTEVSQGFLPYERTPSLLDGAADAGGLLLGMGAYCGGVYLRRGERSSSEKTARR